MCAYVIDSSISLDELDQFLKSNACVYGLMNVIMKKGNETNSTLILLSDKYYRIIKSIKNLKLYGIDTFVPMKRKNCNLSDKLRVTIPRNVSPGVCRKHITHLLMIMKSYNLVTDDVEIIIPLVSRMKSIHTGVCHIYLNSEKTQNTYIIKNLLDYSYWPMTEKYIRCFHVTPTGGVWVNDSKLTILRKR
ncbi:MAG: hypothetical protein COA94_07200 [Rickettsiales bacterium]|nr:MAG: hypothetical protein COA94_07200 [Rickettsiales bacterium]